MKKMLLTLSLLISMSSFAGADAEVTKSCVDFSGTWDAVCDTEPKFDFLPDVFTVAQSGCDTISFTIAVKNDDTQEVTLTDSFTVLTGSGKKYKTKQLIGSIPVKNIYTGSWSTNGRSLTIDQKVKVFGIRMAKAGTVVSVDDSGEFSASLWFKSLREADQGQCKLIKR